MLAMFPCYIVQFNHSASHRKSAWLSQFSHRPSSDRREEKTSRFSSACLRASASLLNFYAQPGRPSYSPAILEPILPPRLLIRWIACYCGDFLTDTTRRQITCEIAKKESRRQDDVKSAAFVAYHSNFFIRRARRFLLTDRDKLSLRCGPRRIVRWVMIAWVMRARQIVGKYREYKKCKPQRVR